MRINRGQSAQYFLPSKKFVSVDDTYQVGKGITLINSGYPKIKLCKYVGKTEKQMTAIYNNADKLKEMIDYLKAEKKEINRILRTGNAWDHIFSLCIQRSLVIDTELAFAKEILATKKQVGND